MAEPLRYIDSRIRAQSDNLYTKLVHSALTAGDAKEDREIAHERAMRLAEKVQGSQLAMAYTKHTFNYRDPILNLRLGTMDLPNPSGLAAGFDKNARIPTFLGEGLGFGLVTVGSVAKFAYSGNERPRIFDLPNNDGLINRMGFPGDGVEEAKRRLDNLPKKRGYGLVISVAASRPSFDRGHQLEDYGIAYHNMLPYGDAYEINVSSPNTPGVRGLQEPEAFRDLVQKIEGFRSTSVFDAKKPVIYKFGPDLSKEQLEKNLTIAKDNGADAVTLTNTSTDPELRKSLVPDQHKEEVGGMSGAFLREKALEATHNAYLFMGDELPILRAGGVNGSDPESLWEALTYGGAIVAQSYASFVRPTTSTPNFVLYGLRGLADAMRRSGMTSMDDFKELRGKQVPFPSK